MLIYIAYDLVEQVFQAFRVSTRSNVLVKVILHYSLLMSEQTSKGDRWGFTKHPEQAVILGNEET